MGPGGRKGVQAALGSGEDQCFSNIFFFYSSRILHPKKRYSECVNLLKAELLSLLNFALTPGLAP